MKKFYALTILLLILLSAQAQQVREWIGASGAWNDASNWEPAGVPSSTDIVFFKGIAATVTNVPDAAVRGLQIINSDIVLNGAAGDVKTLETGNTNTGIALTVGVGASLTIGTQLSVQLAADANAVIDGALIVSDNSKFLTESGLTTRTIVNGMLINNNGTVISQATMLEFRNGAVYEHAGDKGTIPSATWNASSTCVIKGVVSAAPGGLQQRFGNYTWDCEHQAEGLHLASAIPAEIQGNLTIIRTGNDLNAAVYISLPDKVSVEGDLIIKGGHVTTSHGNTTISLAGNFIMSGGNLKANTRQPNASIGIHFTGNTRYSKTAGAIQGIQFNVMNNAALDLGGLEVTGDADFTVEAGGKLMTAHPDGIAESGNTGAIQVSGRRHFSPLADYAYNGAVAQITGPGLPPVVRRLIIENKSGFLQDAGVKLSKTTMVSAELVLLSGYLETSPEHMLTVGTDGSASAFENAFVAGPMRKTGSASFIFPTGWSGQGGGRVPIGFSQTDIPTTIQAEYKRAPATDKGATIIAPLHHINYCEYWELFPLAGNPRLQVTVFHNAHSNCSPVSLIDDFSSARVARSNGSAWMEIGNTDDSINAGIGYIVSQKGVTLNKDDRYFTVGNITTANDPLPVMFDNVWAYEKNNGVTIEWSNLTERDIAIYYVERSMNGMDYTLIGQYLPKNNRDDKASYLHVDPTPQPGTNFYRIKVIEKSTKIIFSKVMRVESDFPKQSMNLYPNPVTGRHLVLGFTGMAEGKYDIRITNQLGQPLYQAQMINKGSSMTQTISLPASAKPGVYSLTIYGHHYRESKLFIVQ